VVPANATLRGDAPSAQPNRTRQETTAERESQHWEAWKAENQKEFEQFQQGR